MGGVVGLEGGDQVGVLLAGRGDLGVVVAVRVTPVALPSAPAGARAYGVSAAAPLFLVLGLAGLALAGVLRRRWR